MPRSASRDLACPAGDWPDRPLQRGEGKLAFAWVEGATSLVRCAAASPLQILSPRPRGPSAWAFLSSHGGGLVSGDRVALSVAVGPGAVALVSTQAQGKVYRSHPAAAEQHVGAHVSPGGALAFLPDPVSCFAGSRYHQRQRFELDSGASLLLVDAVTAGRSACGERWDLERYDGRTEVCAGGRLVLRDALRLDPSGIPLAARMGRLGAIAVLVLAGPAFSAEAERLLAEISSAPAEREARLLVTASPLAGGLLVRVGAERTEDLGAFLRARLAFLGKTLGEDPFARKW